MVGAGFDHGDVDALSEGFHFLTQTRCGGREGELRHRVGHQKRERDASGDRADEDDVATAPLDHAFDGELRELEAREQIDLEQRSDPVEIDLGQGARFALTGVIDQDVDVQIGDLGPVLGVGDIELEDARSLAEFPLQPCDLCFPMRRRIHLVSLRDEGAGGIPADPGACAGNEDCPAVHEARPVPGTADRLKANTSRATTAASTAIMS